jgi:hypothetical protein
MGEVVTSPSILLPVLLCCLTVVRAANLCSPGKISWFQRSAFSVKEIFTDNHNWDRYYYVHRQEVRPVEAGEKEDL